MKNRKIAIIALVLATVLTVGIGYAAYSTTLKIKGTTQITANAMEFTKDVLFTSATSSNTAFGTCWTGTAESKNPTAGSKVAGFEVHGMTAENDTVSFTYTVTNNSAYEINFDLTVIPTPSTSSKCTVSSAPTSTIIAAGATADVTVTVVLKENATATTDPITWNIEYTATATDAAIEAATTTSGN